MIHRRSCFLLFAFLVSAAPCFARHVIFVDNSRADAGNGSYERPYKRIADAVRGNAYNAGDVIYVAEGIGPYQDDIRLQRGQILVGAAYGLDALRDLQLDAPPVPKVQGPGPTLNGSITLAGDNLVAGFTVANAAAACIAAQSAAGPITIRDTWLRTANHANALVLSANDVAVTVTGGGIQATADGNGIGIWGGNGDVTFDGFAIEGSFGNAISIQSHPRGAIVFKGRAAIKIADASQTAVTIAQNGGRVELAVPLQITAHAGGLSINQSTVKIAGGSSWINTTNGTALEIHNSSVDGGLVSISAADAPGGKLNEGVIIDGMRGAFTVSGEGDQPGSGGMIRNARLHGIVVTQSSNVRLAYMALADNGVGERAKCDEQIEAKTNLQCRAALFLRHVSHSELTNITVNGGRQIGLNGNNLDGVTFGGLEIHNVGDAPSDAAVVLDEMRGEVRFSRCALDDAAGGAVVVTQQYNPGRVVFDRCSMAAPNRPVAAPYLMTLRTHGGGRLDVDIRNADLHDNAGGLLRAEAFGSSALRVAVTDSHAQRFGRATMELAAHDSAQLTLALERADVNTPAVVDRPAITVDATQSASACVGLVQSRVYTGALDPPVRITAAPGAKVSLARDATPTPAVTAPPSALSVSACP